ncbi:hypothetical protein AGR8A_Cc30543 [Agrobacterium fabrum str. J-07]|nr:hypothetical protein AGR8A_Cc30543 [Agrobacterium fabrum str. J-07]
MEINAERMFHGMVQIAEGTHEIGKREIAEPRRLLGFRHRVVNADRVIVSEVTHEAQKLTDCLTRLVAGKNDIGHHNRTGIHEGIAGNAVLMFQLNDGIERRSRWFAPHPVPNRLAGLAERQRQHEDLGDTLDRKRHKCIAGRIGRPIDGGDGYAELVGIDLGEFGNVIRNLPLAQSRQHAVIDGIDDRLNILHAKPSPANKKAAPRGGFLNTETRRLTRVEFDDQVRFHDDRVRNVGESRNAGVGGNHLVVINFDVVGNVTLSELNGFENRHQLLGLLTNFDNVASLATVRTDVDANAVNRDVAMVDELTRCENSRNELGAVDDGVQTRLEQADQVFRSIALATVCFVEGGAELLFAQFAVVTLELLLGAQLRAEVAHLALAALAVLARAVFAAVNRGLRTTPDVFAHAAVDFVLGRFALAHRISFSKGYAGLLPNRFKETRPPLRPVSGPLTGFSHANGETTGHVGDIDCQTSALKLQGNQQNTPDITAQRWGGF